MVGTLNLVDTNYLETNGLCFLEVKLDATCTIDNLCVVLGMLPGILMQLFEQRCDVTVQCPSCVAPLKAA